MVKADKLVHVKRSTKKGKPKKTQEQLNAAEGKFPFKEIFLCLLIKS